MPLLRHVVTHDAVALFRHPRDVLAAPFRIEAKPEHAEPEFVADLAHLAQMLMHLVAGLMHGFERRAAQFELAAGFEGDRTSRIVRQRDGVAVFDYRLPAEPGHPLQQSSDPVWSLIGHPAQIGAAEDEFLVLGPNPPFSGRLRSGSEVFDDLSFVGDRFSRRARRGRHPRRNSLERWAGRVGSLGCVGRPHDHQMRARRQSPATAWSTAKAASAAVSARSTRGPSPTRVTKESLPR